MDSPAFKEGDWVQVEIHRYDIGVSACDHCSTLFKKDLINKRRPGLCCAGVVQGSTRTSHGRIYTIRMPNATLHAVEHELHRLSPLEQLALSRTLDD